MPIIKPEDRTNNLYTKIDNNTLRDPNISLAAKGLLCALLSFPSNWTPSVPHLTKSLNTSEHSIRKALKELETHGYMYQMKGKTQKGQLAFDKAIFEIKTTDRQMVIDSLKRFFEIQMLLGEYKDIKFNVVFKTKTIG